MSTGRSPPSFPSISETDPPSKRLKMESNTDTISDDQSHPAELINGIDSSLVRRLPRQALLEIVLQTLRTSTAVKAIVLEKLSSEQLLDDEDEDSNATDLEELSGEEASSQHSAQAEATGPLASLSVLAKLIMEIMNSASAPDGGMPWREFEGIWPPVMGQVSDAIKECVQKGLLVAVDGNDEFVVSTMPMVETVVPE